MQAVLGWTMLTVGGVLYMAQVISTLNFKLAQQWGIQENPQETDPLVQRAERYTAWWDLLMLGWLPFAGVLMLIDHAMWSVMAVIGSAIYVDAAGREVMKHMSIRHEGFRVGGRKQRRIFMGSYLVMALLAIIVLIYTFDELMRQYRML